MLHGQGGQAAAPAGARSAHTHPLPLPLPFRNPQGLYNQADAGGFIKLQALRLRTLGVNRNRK